MPSNHGHLLAISLTILVTLVFAERTRTPAIFKGVAWVDPWQEAILNLRHRVVREPGTPWSRVESPVLRSGEQQTAGSRRTR
ncbi:hypothetical protein J3F83DRAFT_723623 [Trichoderma novae-zelandiae]